MVSKIEKTIARLQSRIEEGQFYEAHQQLRVVSARYVKQENWSAAIDILFSGAKSLLEAGQGGSGGDLCLILVDVYGKSGALPDSENKGKLLTLLRLFDPEEPSRKKFITVMIEWSMKYGNFPAGDPELHHVAGSLYAEEHDAYEAERHLVLGTKDSAEVLAHLEYEWYQEDDSHTAPLYAARAVIPYLLLGNLRDANRSFQSFTNRLRKSNTSLVIQEVNSVGHDLRLYPSLPLLNFLGLLLLTVQDGRAELYRELKTHYSSHLREAGILSDSLEQIGETYFGIQIPRQTNPLLDMMGSLFGGAGSSAPPAKSKKVQFPDTHQMDLD